MDNQVKIATIETSGSGSKYTRVIAIGIGITLSLLLVTATFLALQSGLFTRASDNEPRDVLISDVGSTSVKIGWTTGVETQGSVEYGTNPSSLGFIAPEPVPATEHLVSLDQLTANTTYYFQIRIDNVVYTNGGVPWTFVTKSADAVAKPTIKPSISTIVFPTSAPSTPIPTSINLSPAATVPPQAQPTIDVSRLSSTCQQTTCEGIKGALGNGCSVIDYQSSGCFR